MFTPAPAQEVVEISSDDSDSDVIIQRRSKKRSRVRRDTTTADDVHIAVVHDNSTGQSTPSGKKSDHALIIAEVESLRREVATAKRELQKCQSALQEAKDRHDYLSLCLKTKETRASQLADASTNWASARPWDQALEKAAREVFRIKSFRPLQREALNATLSRRDVFAVLPTGAGKSLIYQLAAVVDGGVTLVITPLVALSNDQRSSLARLGIRAEALDASTPKEVTKRIFKEILPPASEIQRSTRPRRSRLRAGDASSRTETEESSSVEWQPDNMNAAILFVTPERVAKSKTLLSRLEITYEAGHLSRITVDEAHCCSQWGHDFRPDYQRIGILRRQLPETPLLLLTATASPDVIKNVQEIVEAPKCVLLRASIDRPNLHYSVRMRDDSGAVNDVLHIANEEFPNQCGLVYVLSRKDAVVLADELRRNGVDALCYHGDLESDERAAVHAAWSRGKVRVVVATIAFGLGIDKQDVRFVIHATMPASLEGYYQESGRAGRDGEPARCITLFKPQDFVRLSSFVADKGPERLKMLYEMCGYVLGRDASEQLTCRREMIARAFGESAPKRKNDEDREACCDICEGRLGMECLDVSLEARSAVEIMQRYSTKYADDKVTMISFSKLWSNKGANGKRLRGDFHAISMAFDVDTRMMILIKLVLMGGLREYHNFSPYAINAYIAPGQEVRRILCEGDISVVIDVPVDVAVAVREMRANDPIRKRGRGNG